MGFSMNTVYLSGVIADFTDVTPVDFGNGATVKKTTILIQYSDLGNGKQYKIPVEILAGEAKMNMIIPCLKSRDYISLDGRLISTQYLNKNTGKEVTFLKIDPYTINFPSSGTQVIMKNRVTVSMGNGTPYRDMSVEESKQRVRDTIESMKSNPTPPPMAEAPKPQPAMATATSDINLEEEVPF